MLRAWPDVSVDLAFDPKRRAIVLCGGDKSGGSQKRFDSHLKATKESGPTAARRRKIAARAATLIAEKRSLQELRQAHKLT